MSNRGGRRESKSREKTQNTDEQIGSGKGREFTAGEFTPPGVFPAPSFIHPSLSLTHTPVLSPALPWDVKGRWVIG